jgi:polysaccharide biosynthesis protein VpsM
MNHFLALFCAALLLTVNTATAQELMVHDMDVIAANMPDMPMGQGSDSTSLLPEDDIANASDDDLFGTPGGGYVHPFIRIGGEYTDNLFNVDTDHKSNFLTTIAPGIWLAVPRRKEVPLHIAPNNTSAGGLQAALPEYEGFDRINAYLLGGLNYKFYSEDSDLNDYDAIVEGLFKYNLRNGLSFELVDRFTRSQDRFDIGNATAENLRLFHSNIAIADIDWLFTEKLRAKLEYSNFFLDYKEDIDEFLNRDDNAISLYGFFNYSMKTSLFLQYQFIDVSYDTAELKDNEQNYLYGGINWVSSAKTSFHFKAGYQDREFKNSSVNDAAEASNNIDNDTFALELAFQYKVTDKTGLTLAASHKLEESDSFNALDKEVIAAILRYEQEFTERFLGIIDLRYENADYGLIAGERDDHRYVARPALQYVFKDWLMAELAYQYDTRHSSDDFFDYDTNTVSFSLNSAL